MKKRYKHQVTQRDVDLVDATFTNSLYRIDLFAACMRMYNIWAIIQNDIIFNCWRKSTLV